MLMERARRISDPNGNHSYGYGRLCNDYDCGIVDRSEGYREKSPSRSCAAKILPIASPSSSPPSSASSHLPSSVSRGFGFFEHRVSKFDTLAGIAIKYGVEVADIKKMNGLATDLQMFALKSLQIPLPGRHPPSPCLSNGSLTSGQNGSERTLSCHEHTSSRCGNNDLLDLFQSLKPKSSDRKVSPAMSSLQGFYGLKTTIKKMTSEGFEMAVYKKGGSHCPEDGPYLKPSTTTNPPLNRHRKSRSLVNALLDESGESAETAEAGEINSDKWNDKLVRRRQKSDADFTSRAPEMLLKEDNSSGGWFSAITGKGLALRSKAASRTSLAQDSESGSSNPFPLNLMDSIVADSSSGVRKSSSTSSLQDQESNTNSSSMWPTSKWSLKSELLTTASITSSFFDGLPKPLTGRRNKAALD